MKCPQTLNNSTTKLKPEKESEQKKNNSILRVHRDSMHY
jgi:hypothetical protein